jgi:hypothetical protein
LVQRVASSHEVDGATLPKKVDKPLPIIAEAAYRAFHRRHLDEVRAISQEHNDVERQLTALWTHLISRCLYRRVPLSPSALYRRNTAYKHFLPVIRQSPMTVNYNYDDTIEKLLHHTRTDDEKRQADRGFETITDPNLPYRRSCGVIYHPNGYLPSGGSLEQPTGKIVFNDSTFAGQLDDFMMGTFSTMLHFLSQHTWLLLGLSLSDETLRHILHKSALLNPGHYHYHVEYCSSPVGELTNAMRCQAEANLETYNLITLFLDSGEIEALGRCLGTAPEELTALAEESNVGLSYTYYFTGVPAIGKSTSLKYLSDLVIWPEWPEDAPPEMGKPFLAITEPERLKVDAWVLGQIALKNRRVLAAARNSIGLTLVDRCVPDAVTFTPPDGWASKAEALLAAVSSGVPGRTVHPGHVFLLIGDKKEIMLRTQMRGRPLTEEYIEEMQEALKRVYGELGVTHLNVVNLTEGQVVKKIARIIHLEEHQTCDLQKRLEDIRDGIIVSAKTAELKQ